MIAWDAPNDAGFTFETFGQNRRTPVDFRRIPLSWPLSPSKDGYLKLRSSCRCRDPLFEIVKNSASSRKSVPRMRGDEPRPDVVRCVFSRCSPHARG